MREELANYFTDLAKESSQMSFKQYDYDIDPAKAHEYTVTTNGTIVVARNGRKEMLQVPVQFETARAALKTLDKEVQQRLLTVVKPKRVVLFTQGHNERWFEKGATDSDQRPGVRDLREVMRDQGHEVRAFGAADGLMTDVPKDATLIDDRRSSEAVRARGDRDADALLRQRRQDLRRARPGERRRSARSCSARWGSSSTRSRWPTSRRSGAARTRTPTTPTS